MSKEGCCLNAMSCKDLSSCVSHRQRGRSRFCSAPQPNQFYIRIVSSCLRKDIRGKQKSRVGMVWEVLLDASIDPSCRCRLTCNTRRIGVLSSTRSHLRQDQPSALNNEPQVLSGRRCGPRWLSVEELAWVYSRVRGAASCVCTVH